MSHHETSKPRPAVRLTTQLAASRENSRRKPLGHLDEPDYVRIELPQLFRRNPQLLMLATTYHLPGYRDTNAASTSKRVTKPLPLARTFQSLAICTA